jgi:hypothetical protein
MGILLVSVKILVGRPVDTVEVIAVRSRRPERVIV